MAPAELVLTGLVALATAVAAIVTSLQYREQRAQRRRALVRVKFERVTDFEYPTGTPRSKHRLVLTNHGKAPASNLRLSLDGQPVGRGGAVGGLVLLGDVPALLGPGASSIVPVAFLLGQELPRVVTVMWDDPAGRDHSFSTGVFMP